MRKFLMVIIFSALSVCAFAGNGDATPTGDDLFPWPWGTECPFPWHEIEGRYRVLAQKGQPYAGHLMTFRVINDTGLEAPYLMVTQYDRSSRIFATGRGRAQPEDTRIVRAAMSPTRQHDRYSVVVRVYDGVKAHSIGGSSMCMQRDLVPAVTFCPYRGRRCMIDSNYILQKID